MSAPKKKGETRAKQNNENNNNKMKQPQNFY